MATNYRSNYIADVEILRALAILLVMFGHIKRYLILFEIPYIKELFNYLGGGKGVQLFFVISGFVIAKSLIPKLEKSSSKVEFFRLSIVFWIRRFWRLIPSAWLWLFIPFLLFILFEKTGEFGTLLGNFNGLFAGLLNIFNIYFWKIFGNEEFNNSMFVHWTLSLEIQFYTILPFIIFFAKERLPILLLFLVFLQLILFQDKIPRAFRVDGFFLGILLAIWQRRGRTYFEFDPIFLNNPIARFTLLSLLSLSLMVLSGPHHLIPKRWDISLATLISTGLVYIASYDKDYFIRIAWLQKIFLWIASRSYALYLIHIPVYKTMKVLFVEYWPESYQGTEWLLPSSIYLLSVLFVTALLSELNFKFIEEPFRLKGRAIAKKYLNDRKDRSSSLHS